MNKKQQNIKRPPIWIVIALMLSIFVGIFTAIVGVAKIENYDHPYWFGLVFGGMGVILGSLTALKLKPYIAVNPRMRNDYFLPIMHISVGFLGIFLLTGSILNQSLSKVNECDSYIVVDKFRKEAGFRSPEVNSLVVNINGNLHRLYCRYDNWHRVLIGKSINLCLYDSKLGFDFVEITGEKKPSR